MKDLYLMRHGETLFNHRNIIQGVVNSPLLAEGVAQAMHTRKACFEKNGVQFDHVFCSPEGRAIETTEIVTSLPFKTVKDLHEMNFGKLEGCPTYTGCPADQFNTYYGTIGGETTAQVQARMNKALTEIMADPDCHTVLAVAHGCANFAFGQLWAKNDRTDLPDMLYNCSVLHYEFDEKTSQFYLADVFDEDYETEDLTAALASGMAFTYQEITLADF